MAALLVFIMATLAEKQKLLNGKGPFGSNVSRYISRTIIKIIITPKVMSLLPITS